MPSEELNTVEAALVTLSNGELDVVFLTNDKTCVDFEEKTIPQDSFVANGVRVQATAQCLSKGITGVAAKTAAGSRYMVKEFIRSDKVVLIQDSYTLTFSAKGFAAAAEIRKNKRSGL
jgi:hypothetical protein